MDISLFLKKKNTTYIIRHEHKTNKNVTVGENSTIVFEGGNICANITLNNTKLEGNVRLQGSTLSGNISNKTFDASWLCYRDGKTDDASAIQNLLNTFNNIHFPKGTYLLVGFHKSKYPVEKPYHLGITRSKMTITGEKGSVIRTATMGGVLNIHSKPYDIKHTIADISISGLTFEVKNESDKFESYQEHCHTISMMGAKNVTIKDCYFKNFWGDAICTNHYGDNPNTGERARNTNIKILNNTIDGYKCVNRNGVSVINGEKVIIKQNTFNNCSHKNMPGAIDVEPNYSFYTCNDITISENSITNCQGQNGAISIVCGPHGGIAKNVNVTKNKVYKSRRGIEFAVEDVSYAENIKIEDNYFDAETDPYIFYGKGKVKTFEFNNNTFKAKTKVKFGGSIKIERKKMKGNEFANSSPSTISNIFSDLKDAIVSCFN